MVTVTVAPKPEVDTLPKASTVLTTGCVVNAAPAVAPEGLVVKASPATVPAVYVTVAGDPTPTAEAFSVAVKVALPAVVGEVNVAV